MIATGATGSPNANRTCAITEATRRSYDRRLWSARATPQNWPAYEKHFIDHVVPNLHSKGTSHQTWSSGKRAAKSSLL